MKSHHADLITREWKVFSDVVETADEERLAICQAYPSNSGDTDWKTWDEVAPCIAALPELIGALIQTYGLLTEYERLGKPDCPYDLMETVKAALDSTRLKFDL